MSPLIILILMLSTCTLLVMALVAVRRRANTTPIQAAGSVHPGGQAPNDANKIDDLSAFDDLNLDEFLKDVPQVSPDPGTSNQQPLPASGGSNQNDLIDLVSRYRFFQGKNLETFERLVGEKNTQGVETLIREKFLAQNRNDAGAMAKEVSGKLVKLMT